MRMGAFEWMLLITLSIVWGGAFFFGDIAVAHLPPLTVAFLRVGIAAAALLIACRAFGVALPRSRSLWGAFLIMGAINNMIPFSLILWGQTHIASGLASILNATTPLFTVVLAHFLTSDEKMTPLRLAGVIAGLAGVVIMIGGDVLHGLSNNLWAQLAVLGAAVSYAFAGIFGRRFKDQRPVVTATGQLTCSSALLLPIVLLADKPWSLTMPGVSVWAAIVALALVSTALAYIMFFRILSAAGATNLLLVTFLIPVSAILLGTAFLNEILETQHIAGMILIALGLALIDGRVPRRMRALASRTAM